jgi:hypothetical protein
LKADGKNAIMKIQRKSRVEFNEVGFGMDALEVCEDLDILIYLRHRDSLAAKLEVLIQRCQDSQMSGMQLAEAKNIHRFSS